LLPVIRPSRSLSAAIKKSEHSVWWSRLGALFFSYFSSYLVAAHRHMAYPFTSSMTKMPVSFIKKMGKKQTIIKI